MDSRAVVCCGSCQPRYSASALRLGQRTVTSGVAAGSSAHWLPAGSQQQGCSQGAEISLMQQWQGNGEAELSVCGLGCEISQA